MARKARVLNRFTSVDAVKAMGRFFGGGGYRLCEFAFGCCHWRINKDSLDFFLGAYEARDVHHNPELLVCMASHEEAQK